MSLDLTVLPDVLAVCRLSPDAKTPSWVRPSGLAAITWTSDETSVVCPASDVPAGVQKESGWRAIRVAGPLEFGLTGILVALTRPLAEAGIPVFAMSTYDTDYLLVKELALAGAVEALMAAGHTFDSSAPRGGFGNQMTADQNRAPARELAQRHVADGNPLGWFEVLYATAEGDSSGIPWADLSPNPNLVSWLAHRSVAGSGHRALKIGCGLGDDAEELSRRGFDTTAFDVSPTAITWCRRRFPESSVNYVEADLLQPPSEWVNAFDFVLESYTLQVLPPEIRAEAARRAASFVAPGGTLLVIARGREPGEPEGAMPWPLTREELGTLAEAGLTEVHFEDYVDDENPPVRRFRATYTRT